MDLNGYNKRSDPLVLDGKFYRAWKTRAYPVPAASRRSYRWKAFALRRLGRWTHPEAQSHPVTVMVPALCNSLPAEMVAMGWLNEIDALVRIRQRLTCAAGVTGWDAFTFHTLQNLDHYFDTTIAAVRETWVKEGNLAVAAVVEAKRRFGKPYDYHRAEPRLVENLVFQSSLMDWLRQRAEEAPLRFHVLGTGLLSALVSSGAVGFAEAVKAASRIGRRWDQTLGERADGKTEDAIGWSRFHRVGKLLEGRSTLSLGIAREDLPPIDAPAPPFWYSSNAEEAPVLVRTAQEAIAALESVNIRSWSPVVPSAAGEPIRGWLVSSLHPMARICRWSVSNYLLATPASSMLFLDHIAASAQKPLAAAETKNEAFQNRLRLSRMKVTGP